MNEGKTSEVVTVESAEAESSERAAGRPYEAPRVERRIPVVRNTLGQPPGPGGNASGNESIFP